MKETIISCSLTVNSSLLCTLPVILLNVSTLLGTGAVFLLSTLLLARVHTVVWSDMTRNLQILFFQTRSLLPINHQEYCLTTNQRYAGQETNFLPRIHPKIHLQLSSPELMKNRRLHYDLYGGRWSTTSAYMFGTNVGAAVRTWWAVSLLEPGNESETLSSFPSPASKASPSTVFPRRILSDVWRIPGNSPRQECGQEGKADPVLFRLNH